MTLSPGVARLEGPTSCTAATRPRFRGRCRAGARSSFRPSRWQRASQGPVGSLAKTSRNDRVSIALPTGVLLPGALKLLARAHLARLSAPELGRKLLVERPGLRVVLVRPADVPAYVDHGAADLGIVGKDVVWEYAGGPEDPHGCGAGHGRAAARGGDRWRLSASTPRPGWIHRGRAGGSTSRASRRSGRLCRTSARAWPPRATLRCASTGCVSTAGRRAQRSRSRCRQASSSRRRSG